MPNQYRILFVEDDEELNQSIANSLHKDGYLVQGVRTGAEAIHVLWTQEYDVVIGDLKTPGADGFELLQWLRAFRPNTRMIMLAAAGSASTRTYALEGGVVSYLEKPVDLHLLKEELRRLLQQTGFSANLDSFDLLDVIQIITMSRKSIALLVNTGVEEHGILRFQGGELVWAEYSTLRGEEAFFALAAHKNGTVIHQPWNEQITPNVRLPLSRLIFQALQYRAKYATMQQLTDEQETITRVPSAQEQVNDSPFFVLTEEAQALEEQLKQAQTVPIDNDSSKEWWQQTDKHPRNGHATDNLRGGTSDTPKTPTLGGRPDAKSTNITPSTVRKTPASERTDLPSWLTEQPTKTDLPALRPSALSDASPTSATPVVKPTPAEWQPGVLPQPIEKTAEPIPFKHGNGLQKAISTTGKSRRTSSPEWQPPENVQQSSTKSEPLQSLSASKKVGDKPSQNEHRESGPLLTTAVPGLQQTLKHNHTALVAALQTLGYSISGFIAAAVVSIDGQLIAQVAVDDLDISQMCGHLGLMLQGAQGALQNYEHAVISSADRHILLRMVDSECDAFQVLITTLEAEQTKSLEVMTNVEGAIAAAFR